MVHLELSDGAAVNLLNQFPIEELLKRVESKGYSVLSTADLSHYVNIQKSMGTEPFYDMLVEAIEKGELSLELLIGKVAIKKLVPKNPS